MERAETGRELVVVLFLTVSGVMAGLFVPSWKLLVLISLGAGIALNVWLLTTAVARSSQPERVLLAAVAGIPAGVYDAIKVFLIGAVVRGLVSLIR
jgi:hypothetical protein